MPARIVSLLKGKHDSLQAARELTERGYAVAPLRPKSKKFLTADLPKGPLNKAQITRYFSRDINVGIRCGEPSENRVDIDLDAAEALALAPGFLPPTEMRHGPPSKGTSHYWYQANPCPRTEVFRDVDRAMLLELRSTGAVTMVPPSIHPSGERLHWESIGSPTLIESDKLRFAVSRLAACALVARHWPKKGSRHHASLALAGLLLRGGVTESDAQTFMDSALRQAGDEEWEQRRENIFGTARTLGDGLPATGGPTLAKLLGQDGPEVVRLLRQWLGLTGGRADRPSINAGDLDLERVAAEAWRALLQANQPPVLYIHGTRIVRLQRRNGNPPAIHGLSLDELRHRLARVAYWHTLSKGEPKPARPPMDVVRDLMAEPEPPLPVLSRVVETPVFAADGTFDVTPGYQAKTRVFYAPTADFVIPAIPKRPTVADLDLARRLIEDELLADFPFTEDGDLAHGIALLLLPLARNLILGPTPLHLIEKPTPGTGGSLLADVLSFPALGRSIPTMTEGENDDEWRKRLTAKLLDAPSVLLIDNILRRLDSAALAAALTSTIYEDRILRESRIVQIPVHTAWIATGNNPTMSDELARRTVRIRLDARMERPWERKDFRHPKLIAWVAEHRGELIWAAAVFVRAWLARGRPAGSEHLGMFEAWSHTMGGILAVAGIPGFLANRRALYEDEASEAGTWRMFVSCWWERHGPTPVSISDLFDLVQDESVPLVLTGRDERAQRTSLGMRLVHHRDRQFGNFRIISAGERQGSRRWRLVEMTPPPGRRSTREQQGRGTS